MSGAWQPTLGAFVAGGATSWRVWAPRPERVALVLDPGPGERVVPMTRDGEYWRVTVEGPGAGSRYLYELDGGRFPDPCSRSQPEGPHGASEVIDPGGFPWSDGGWQPPNVADLVLYECHIGTLTPEGTFDAAIGELPRLRDLGLSALEVMPVASFPGRWGWGYDGVNLFAPFAGYGGPEGFRRFVDAAHGAGIAVVLDVVYNHFGPDGNYTAQFSDRYTTPKHATPWGDAINFDDAGASEVRRFFVENVLHWVHEYHVDGFRFDATHVIRDESARHILSELSEAAEQYTRVPGRRPYLIAESHENDPVYLRPRSEGGYGMDGLWADDFHHGVRTILTGEKDGYLAGFPGTAEALAETIEHRWLYRGQEDMGYGDQRGRPAQDRPWYQFLYCIQNHDQVGNRAFGQRLNVMESLADVRTATLLLLMLPATPLLFQGQEFFATTPFQYFTDHNEELGRQVTAGRREEFRNFKAFADPRAREMIPDPQDARTFERSRLNTDESEHGLGLAGMEFHRELLRVRREDPVLRRARREATGIRAWAVAEAVVVEIASGEGRRVVVANFGKSVEVEVEGVQVMLHSEEPRFGGNAVEVEVGDGTVMVPGHCGVVMRAGKVGARS